MIDSVYQFLLKKKVGCIHRDGNIPAASRQATVAEFQEQEAIRYLKLVLQLMVPFIVLGIFDISRFMLSSVVAHLRGSCVVASEVELF
ncbi:hypothetical protein Nepgr_022769 [Nepenthes gracilis]|uniref:Uncharacterized protein n=1 Tax=Nepenthes gracilis TaxID=150966 RepID=A0AAD3T2N8_NEPGR|nr:hypothetical protein Nepgr_022769 [Nepenthes gracilis]